jgi:hypothetical protein
MAQADQSKAFEHIIRYLFFEDELASLTKNDKVSALSRFKETGTALPEGFAQKLERGVESLTSADIPSRDDLLRIPREKLTIRQAMVLSLYESGLNIYANELLQGNYPNAVQAFKEAGVEFFGEGSGKRLGPSPNASSPTPSTLWKNMNNFKNKVRDNLGTYILNARKKGLAVPLNNVTGSMPLSVLDNNEIISSLKLAKPTYINSIVNGLAAVSRKYASEAGVSLDIAASVRDLAANIETKFGKQFRGSAVPTGGVSSESFFTRMEKIIPNMQSPVSGADVVDHNTYKVGGFFFSKHQERISNALDTVVYDPVEWGNDKPAFEAALRKAFDSPPPYIDTSNPNQIHISKAFKGNKFYAPIPLSEGWGILLRDQANAILNQGKHIIADKFPQLFGDVTDKTVLESFVNAGLRDEFKFYQQEVEYTKTKGGKKPEVSTKIFRKWLSGIFKDEGGFSKEEVNRGLGHSENVDVADKHYLPKGETIADPEVLNDKILEQNTSVRRMRNWLGARAAQVLGVTTFNDLVRKMGIDSPSLTTVDAPPLNMGLPDSFRGQGIDPQSINTNIGVSSASGETPSGTPRGVQDFATDPKFLMRQRMRKHETILKTLYPDLPAEKLQEWVGKFKGIDDVFLEVLEDDANIQVVDRDKLDFKRIDRKYGPEYSYSDDLDNSWNRLVNRNELAQGQFKLERVGQEGEAVPEKTSLMDFATSEDRNELLRIEGESSPKWRQRIAPIMTKLRGLRDAAKAAVTSKGASRAMWYASPLLGWAYGDLKAEEQAKREEEFMEPRAYRPESPTEGQMEALRKASRQKAFSKMSPGEQRYHTVATKIDPWLIGAGGVGLTEAATTPGEEPTPPAYLKRTQDPEFQFAGGSKEAAKIRQGFVQERELDELEKEEGIVF